MKKMYPKWNNELTSSENIIFFLKYHNFKIESSPIGNTPFYYYSAKGKGVILFFTDILPEYQVHLHPEMDNRLIVDNAKCFDKMTRCPFSYNLPTNDTELDFLLNQFEWISSNDGLKHCQQTFGMEFIKYPRNLRKK